MTDPDLGVTKYQEELVINHTAHCFFIIFVLLRVVLKVVKLIRLKVRKGKENSFLIHDCFFDICSRVIGCNEVPLMSFDNDNQVLFVINEFMEDIFFVSLVFINLFSILDRLSHMRLDG